MANVFIEDTTMTAIGDAIREKTGKTEKILPADMAEEISSIAGGVVLVNIEVYIADYADADTVTTTEGVVDIYDRTIVS